MSRDLERRLAAALAAAGGALSTPPDRLGAVVRRGRRRQAAARAASTMAVVAAVLVAVGGVAWLRAGADTTQAGNPTAPPPGEAEPAPVLPPDSTIVLGTLPVIPGQCPALGQVPEGEPRTAVVAVVPGVVDVEVQDPSEITVELVGDDGLSYLYSGLDGVADGIADGERVMEGEQLGTVPLDGDQRLRFEVRTAGDDRVPVAGTRFEDCEPAPDASAPTTTVPDTSAPPTTLDPEMTATTTAPATTVPPPPLGACPVRGELTDDFGAERGGRLHRGVDVFAPRGAPVFAVTDGTVETRSDPRTGNAVHLVGDDAVRFVYTHLHSYATGIDTGVRVDAGAELGSVGTTGDAGGVPHLHFEVWVDGAPVDPYSLVHQTCR